jgi:multidrug efflux pump subunit AcrA (membrane-fusion protein)
MARSPNPIRGIRAIRGFLSVVFALGAACGSVLASAADENVLLTIDSVVLRPKIEAEVPARQTGVLATINVTEGDRVEKDQELVALDDRVARLAAQHAELELSQARAKADNNLNILYAAKALDVARAELKRSVESNEKFPNSISGSQLDVERLTIEKLELERQQAERELELARFDAQIKENALEAAMLDLELHHVRAPFAGVVTVVRGRAGEWVEPGTAVLRIVAVDQLRIEGFAPADKLDILRPGAPLLFELGSEVGDEGGVENAEVGAPETYAAHLAFVNPEVDPVNRQVRIWAELNKPAPALRPGAQGRLIFLRTMK